LALTRQEVADLLGVSLRTVGYAIARGDLRVMRLGRCTRIPVKEFLRVLHGQRVRQEREPSVYGYSEAWVADHSDN
jgi:excisionase family DNA binding protein